jgi:AraC family transcriptional regulator of adaptative response/methylated-DNA-[protein]-cysteine methyltransferase
MLERVVIADEGECWKAVAHRDAAADGDFVYAVVTTGIYCRPSCPTPTPLRRNVRFFSDPAAAEAAGFSACKRCRPTQPSPLAWQVATVGKACDILQTSEHAPSLTLLAAAVGVSRFHFHRIFKAVLGTTPGEYAHALRWRRLTDRLVAGHPVAEAIYGAGYGSVSRAYEKARQALGMTPATWRAGGAGTKVRFAVVERGTGLVLVAATAEGICTIEFGDDAAELEARLRRRLPAAVIDRLDADATARVAIAMRRAELPALALGLAADVREVALRARLRDFLGQGLSARPQSRVAQPKVAWPVRLPASSGSVPGLAGGG